MRLTIQNQHLIVEIDSLGAQLASIRTPDGAQYLWQGDPEIWARRAPILFPIIGRLREGAYLLDGVPYTISQHGFARDMEFQVSSHSQESVSFSISDTQATRAVYPFAFTLTVTYSLRENTLIKSHRVENRSDRDMLYELGGHDGFRAPIEPGVPMTAYRVVLPQSSVRFYGMDEHCLLTPKGEEHLLEGGALPLTPSTYGLDTLVLDAPADHFATLTDQLGRPRVTLSFPDFPYLGLWTQDKPFDTGYVCIEPWTTLPDAVFADRELKEKVGIRRLAPGQSEVLTYTTTIHRKEH